MTRDFSNDDQVTINSSGRLLTSITQLNEKSAARNSELETDGVACKY